MKKEYTMPDTQYWRFISGNICQVGGKTLYGADPMAGLDVNEGGSLLQSSVH